MKDLQEVGLVKGVDESIVKEQGRTGIIITAVINVLPDIFFLHKLNYA